MAVKRGLSGASIHKSSGGGSRFPLAILILLALLVPSLFFFGRGLHTTDRGDLSTGPRKKDVDWRQRLALQHFKSLFTKEVIDVITTSTSDMGPLSLDIFKKNNLSASWKFIGAETSVVDTSEVGMTCASAQIHSKPSSYSCWTRYT